ncbi:MAG: hypothetical protein Q4C95_10570 [Planctomycetia bacterium]|nr:hypothetical protein [Planctomycetia bacterium]
MFKRSIPYLITSFFADVILLGSSKKPFGALTSRPQKQVLTTLSEMR